MFKSCNALLCVFVALLFCNLSVSEDLFEEGEVVSSKVCALDGDLTHGPASALEATTNFFAIYENVPVNIRSGQTFYVHKPSWEAIPSTSCQKVCRM
jgi:hypothetical protein